MTKYDINPELDQMLRLSLQDKENFIIDLRLVYAFHQHKLIVPSKIFYVPIEDRKALPIFTTEADLELLALCQMELV